VGKKRIKIMSSEFPTITVKIYDGVINGASVSNLPDRCRVLVVDEDSQGIHDEPVSTTEFYFNQGQRVEPCRICQIEPSEPDSTFCRNCDTPEARAAADEHFDKLRPELLKEDQVRELIKMASNELVFRIQPKYRDAVIKAAREAYQSDDIEIDDNAVVSQGDDGDFVLAWVFVSEVTCPDCGEKVDVGSWENGRFACPNCEQE
jgi:hypothetical protein